MTLTSTSKSDAPTSPRLALVLTSLGALLAFVNSSIVIISLPAIFRGLQLDPLEPGNVGYLLWMIVGYLVVTSVLVVAAGRLGDLYGRSRVFTAGCAVFTVGTVLCALDPARHGTGALLLIAFRCLSGVGGAAIMANSTAILVDAFPAERRGVAVGINQVTGIAGSFAGLVIGGLLADSGWRLVFWVSVPFGVLATVWSAAALRDAFPRRAVGLDLLGNVTFAVGLVAILVAITYGIQPAGGHDNGWRSPFVISCFALGAVAFPIFVAIERRARQPMFDLSLFRIRAFSFGNLAGLLASVARGGMQFILILWLQGIWLPLHGYSFSDTPLWAGVYLLPLTAGFLVAGPVSGYLSDRFGARPFATGGMLLAAATFALLIALPVEFPYSAFAALLAANGLATGLFTAPNTTGIMNAVPAGERGVASGIRATFQNAGQVLSIGLFFGLVAAGLSRTLPAALRTGLVANGVPSATAAHAASTPAIGPLFAAFLGDNPVRKLLPPSTIHALPAAQQATLTGTHFFPTVLSSPFHDGLELAFGAAIVLCLLAAAASWLRGGKYVHDAQSLPASEREPIGATA